MSNSVCRDISPVVVSDVTDLVVSAVIGAEVVDFGEGLDAIVVSLNGNKSAIIVVWISFTDFSVVVMTVTSISGFSVIGALVVIESISTFGEPVIRLTIVDKMLE